MDASGTAGVHENVAKNAYIQLPSSYWMFISACIGVLLLVWYKKYLMRPVWCPSSEKLDGKTVLITGANSGIGAATALELARRGAGLILASRNVALSTVIAKDITSETGNSDIEIRHLDLSSTQSIRDFTSNIIKSEKQVNILINNAGTSCPAYTTTEDFYERTLAVNYLGPFLLTRLILPVLKVNAPSRIINIAAHTHVFGRIHFEDLQLTNEYSEMSAYCQSKLALIMFTRTLADFIRDSNVNVYAVHPGVTLTPMRHGNNMLKKVLLQWFCRKPIEGAQTTVYCAVSKKLGKESGRYYSNCAPSTPITVAFNDDVTGMLWEKTESLLDLAPLTDTDSMVLEALD